MEKKKLGNNLIIYGTILYVLSVFTNIITILIFSIILSIIVLISLIFINIIAINLIIIGGIWAKKSRDYWLLLIGLILFLSAMFLSVLDVIGNLVGAHPIIPFQISTVILVIAILCIIAGALMKPHQKEIV
jgi:hypothetical protein